MPSKQGSQKPYVTQSLPVAAALWASGFKEPTCTAITSSRYEFAFVEKDAPDLERDYFRGKLQVDAQQLFNCFEHLRTVVRSGGK